MRPESVVSISSSRKFETRSSMLSMLPVCSPALNMRMIMLGKIGFLPSAAEMPSPCSMSPAAVLMAFSMTTLPTVWETICSTSRMGTPLRTSEASVRVKRTRQILCAMGPKTGSLMRRASQKIASRLGLDEMQPAPYGRAAGDDEQEKKIFDEVADVHHELGRSGQLRAEAGVNFLEGGDDFHQQEDGDEMATTVTADGYINAVLTFLRRRSAFSR